jgi:hypothetical protein
VILPILLGTGLTAGRWRAWIATSLRALRSVLLLSHGSLTTA